MYRLNNLVNLPCPYLIQTLLQVVRRLRRIILLFQSPKILHTPNLFSLRMLIFWWRDQQPVAPLSGLLSLISANNVAKVLLQVKQGCQLPVPLRVKHNFTNPKHVTLVALLAAHIV
jgi:hypothetical protein